MNLLAIDTSTDRITLGLSVGEKKDFFIGDKGCKRHNSTLLSAIDELLDRNKITVRDIDVIGVVCGPGSFTGIRIGVSTANALAMATQAKIVEITSLEQLFDGKSKIILLDCGHDSFYSATFSAESGEVFYQEISVKQVDECNFEKVYLTESDPEKILKKCIEKAQNAEFVSQAKPFYMKKSSAERM